MFDILACGFFIAPSVFTNVYFIWSIERIVAMPFNKREIMQTAVTVPNKLFKIANKIEKNKTPPFSFAIFNKILFYQSMF